MNISVLEILHFFFFFDYFFSSSGHFEYFLKPIFIFLNQNPWNREKLILLMYIQFSVFQ